MKTLKPWAKVGLLIGVIGIYGNGLERLNPVNLSIFLVIGAVSGVYLLLSR